jgi:hypothetical protein
MMHLYLVFFSHRVLLVLKVAIYTLGKPAKGNTYRFETPVTITASLLSLISKSNFPLKEFATDLTPALLQSTRQRTTYANEKASTARPAIASLVN